MFVLANNQLITMSYYGEPGNVDSVWAKATKIRGEDPNEIRRDAAGDIIRFSQHGNDKSEYGWDIDHIVPQSLEVDHYIDNLQPLHYRTNRSFGNRLDKPVIGKKHSAGVEYLLKQLRQTSKYDTPVRIIPNDLGYTEKTLFVKQSPRTASALATILDMNRNTMTVSWLDTGRTQVLINDRSLIDGKPLSYDERCVRRSSRNKPDEEVPEVSRRPVRSCRLPKVVEEVAPPKKRRQRR